MIYPESFIIWAWEITEGETICFWRTASLLPFSRKLQMINLTLAGLLTYSLFDAFPSYKKTVAKDFKKSKELTAAGTVQVLHLIPF